MIIITEGSDDDHEQLLRIEAVNSCSGSWHRMLQVEVGCKLGLSTFDSSQKRLFHDTLVTPSMKDAALQSAEMIWASHEDGT